jgi:hypothetical protein
LSASTPSTKRREKHRLTGTLKDVSKEGSVTDLLLSHESNQVTLLGVDAVLLELGVREPSETVVEEVELDPFLVQSEVETLEVELRRDGEEESAYTIVA